MGPDATSCLDLDECIIDPDVRVKNARIRLVNLLTYGGRFARMVNVKMFWVHSNVCATMVSLYLKTFSWDVWMMTSVP